MTAVVDRDLLVNKLANSRKLFLYLLIVFFVQGIVCLYEYSLGFSYYTSVISLVIFITSIYLIITKDSFFFALMFLYLFANVNALFSMALVESGAFMGEIQKYGYPIGAMGKLSFYTICFIIGVYSIIYLFLYKRGRLEQKYYFLNSEIVINGYIVTFILILLFLFLIVLVYGSPLFIGIDRVSYFKNVVPSYVKSIYDLLPQISCMNGVIYAISRNAKVRKRIMLFLFISTIIALILTGEKFSKLLLTSYFFWLPYLLIHYRYTNLKINFKLIMGTVLFFVLVISMVIYNYAAVKGTQEIAWLLFQNRLALQAQTFWAVDQYIEIFQIPNFDYFYNHVFGLGNVSGEKVGLYYLMHFVSPITALIYYDDGATFTHGFPSIILLGTGYFLGVFVIFFIGCFMGGVVYIFSQLIARNNIIVLIFGVKMFFACYLAFVMGSMELLAGWKFLLYLIGSIFFYKVNFNDGTSTKRL